MSLDSLLLELRADEFFFQNEESFSETVIDNEGFENILKFLNFTGGYGSCKIGKFVWFIKNVGGNLVDRKIGDLVTKEGLSCAISLNMDTISDMKVWIYWSSLL